MVCVAAHMQVGSLEKYWCQREQCKPKHLQLWHMLTCLRQVSGTSGYDQEPAGGSLAYISAENV